MIRPIDHLEEVAAASISQREALQRVMADVLAQPKDQSHV